MRLRHLFRDFTIYGIGNLLLRATVLITLPIYTRVFTPEDYGIWNFVFTAVGFFGGLLALGGDSAYARFYFEAKTERERQVITSTWLGFLAGWSICICILLLPFSGYLSQWSFESNDYALLFILALLTTPITLINGICGQVLRNQFRAKWFTGLNIISTLLIIGPSLFAVLILDLGVVGVLGGTFVGTAAMLPVRLWSVRTMLRPAFSINVLRDLLSFGVPLVPMSLAYWVFASSDRLVIGKLSTLDQLGLYAVATSLTMPLGFVNQALGQAWSPYAVQVYEKQPHVASILFGQVATYILIGFGVLSVGITTFAREALVILSTPSFYSAAIAVGPLTLGFMAYASTQVTALSISLTKKTKIFALFSWVAALLNLGLNFLFVPRWGMIMASWSTAASYIFLTVAYYITAQRLWPIAYEKRRILITIGLTFIFTIAAPFLPTHLSFWLIIVVKVVYFLVYCSLLFVFQVIDHREWQLILSVFQKKNVTVAGTID